MAIQLLVHLEPTDDPDSPYVWWAESNEVPGFSAAASHLDELLDRSKKALTELLGREADIAPTMVPNDDPVATPTIILTGDLTFNEFGPGEETVRVSPPTKTRIPA